MAVFADVDVLRTLPVNEMRAGLMEVVKAGIIRDAKLFRLLEARGGELLEPKVDAALLTDVVARSGLAMKAAVVGEDERETGVRMILNLGHTIGHAIESVTGYRKLLHSEAVGWGMLVAITIAAERGLLNTSDQVRAAGVGARAGADAGVRASAEALLVASGRDKKNRGGTRRFVLPRGIGDAVVVEDVGDDELLGMPRARCWKRRGRG